MVTIPHWGKRAIIVCTPNNPTGPIITSAEFADFIARVPADCLVILDEAGFVSLLASGQVGPPTDSVEDAPTS